MEELSEARPSVKAGGMRYVRFYPSDWRSDAIGLSVEQEGMLIRVCAYLFETGRMVPADDRMAARHLGMHTNAYRKLIRQLKRLGHVIQTPGGWISRRAQERFLEAAHREFEAGFEEAPARQATPAPRWNTRQDTIGVSGGVSGGVLNNTPQDTPIETPHVLGGVCSEKHNDFNGPKNQPKAKSQERESDRQTDSLLVARESGVPDEAAERMVADVLKAMPGCDRSHAETWLSGLLVTNGQEAVQQAWMMLQNHRAEGRPVVRVLPWWSKTAATLKERNLGRKPAGGGSGEPRPLSVYEVWKSQQPALAAANRGGLG